MDIADIRIKEQDEPLPHSNLRVNLRPWDMERVYRLQEKLELNYSDIVRRAIRLLARSEGVDIDQ